MVDAWIRDGRLPILRAKSGPPVLGRLQVAMRVVVESHASAAEHDAHPILRAGRSCLDSFQA